MNHNSAVILKHFQVSACTPFSLILGVRQCNGGYAYIQKPNLEPMYQDPVEFQFHRTVVSSKQYCVRSMYQDPVEFQFHRTVVSMYVYMLQECNYSTYFLWAWHCFHAVEPKSARACTTMESPAERLGGSD